LLALTGCSLLSKGKATVSSTDGARNRASDAGGAGGGGAPHPAAAPPVQRDEEDPPYLRSALDKIDKMAAMIDKRDFAAYAPLSAEFQSSFLLRNGWADEKKHDMMKARLDALDAQAFPAFGGRLAAVGDGKRALKVDEDAVEAAGEAIQACRRATETHTAADGRAIGELTAAVATYEKALERVKKIDPNAMRYLGEHKKLGQIDVPTDLMSCEVKLAAVKVQFEDEYAPEVATRTEMETGCGTVDWLAEGVQIDAGKFAPYSRTQGGASFVERVPCNKLARANRYPKAFADAARDFAAYVDVPLGKLVIVTDGKPYTQVREEDLHVYRYQKLRAYSTAFKFAANPCGEAKLFCEAGGSRAAGAYNRVEHNLARAQVHAGVHPELCKAHLKDAKANAAWFDELHADMVKEGKWTAGAVYKTRSGAKLKESELIAAFADKAKLADDRLVAKYCAAAQKPDH
jgi:hypothetical protein